MQSNNLNKISFLALRIMGSLIFITAAFNHLFQTSEAAARLEKAKMGFLATSMADPEILVILSGIGLLVGGLMLLVGFQTRKAALLLILILIPITLTMQVGSVATMGPLFKNIAIMGVLLFFMANGAVYYGLDQYLVRKNQLTASTNNAVKMMAVVFLGVMAISSCSTAQAVNSASDSSVSVKNNYGILISQPDHLKAAVNTAQTMRNEEKYNADKIVIMACAKSVEAFKKDSEMKLFFEAGKAAGVTYKVCGMSLDKFKIAPSEIMDGAEIIPNGLTYMFDLQQEGFITVEL
ncbi:DoxX family membrane protein [Adhaeribacter sp. BT258]|uniref:DoxX family membrane protein n=1 Tax=Adhaeribacter terrigena TaxID=2793070 RepID=A0ABS1BZQ3_9BACT|nr:DoxX family membrane protein [Adhaeribacter terrigena]MBK0401823.1 DoxX family membrane protein [Adhaeribacter terrigena]